MYIEIFHFLVYRQLFSIALLKTSRPPRSLLLTIVILNLYLIFIWEEFNKVCFLEKWQNCLFCLAIGSPDFSITVKAGHVYPPRFYEWIDHLKNEAVSHSQVIPKFLCHSPNWCQIQSSISACLMSSEYFTRTSLYLVRLKILEWIKFLRRRLHQIQENWAGRNFITASCVNSRLIMHARMQRSIWNLQLATD